jgi:tRNA pseudouridine32 synthase/23S rRNA pseudouridine746 synthase
MPDKVMLPTIDGVSPSSVVTPGGHWPTMLAFLIERIPAVSVQEWTRRMTHHEVLDAQGLPLAADAPFKAHTRLHYYRRLAHEHPIPFEATVVFQDDFIVVTDKPHFLPVTPKGRYVQETLLVRLKRQLGIDSLVPMHRLDRETAGLLAFTIQPDTRHAYQALFRDRTVSKVYEAIAPAPSLGIGEPRFPITRRSRLKESAQFMTMQEVDGEPNAETRIELVEQKGPRALYRLHPLTGQKHQLRAHMNALGLPLEGDRIYPKLQAEQAPDAPPDYSSPLQLLACGLSFTDPISGQLRQFQSRLKLNW